MPRKGSAAPRHEKGSGPAPLPLLITHGWPGSVAEFLEIIKPLAHPERFGGKENDAFDVIARPGYPCHPSGHQVGMTGAYAANW